MNETKSTFQLDPTLLDVHCELSLNRSTLVRVKDSIISYEDLLKGTQCLPSSRYKWGFSSILLFTFGVASIPFLVVLQTLSCVTYSYSRSANIELKLSIYQDILDISEELRACGYAVPDANGKELSKLIYEGGDGVLLDVEGLPLNNVTLQKQRREEQRQADHAESETDPRRRRGNREDIGEELAQFQLRVDIPSGGSEEEQRLVEEARS